MAPTPKRDVSYYLHRAVMQNNLSAVKYYLDCGAHPTDSNDEGRTAIAVAVQQRKRKIANALISKCPTNMHEPETGLSFLHIACMLDNREAVERFLESGTAVNHPVASARRFRRDRENWRSWPVRSVVYFDSKLPLRLSPTDDRWAHYTPLHFAAENRAMEVMELLLKMSANVNAKDSRGNTPLHLACALEKPMDVAVKLLSVGADPNAQNSKGAMPPHVAIERQNLDLLKTLVTYGARLDRPMWGALNLTCLHLACQVKNTDIIEFIIQNKVDINASDWTGGTALHAMIDIVPESSSEYKKALDILEDAGMNLNQQDHIGHTALHRAISQTHPVMTRLLLEQGASMTITDRYGRTPIWYVRQSQRRDLRQIIINHIQKMRLVWPTINIVHYQQPSYCHDMTPERRDLIRSCKAELEKIRNHQIDKKTTLFDLISHKSRTLASNHVNNEELCEFINGDLCEQEYPMYAYLIRMRFRYNTRRFELIERTKEPFARIINLQLPSDITDILFRMLDGRDLENIIEARRLQVIAEHEKMIKEEVQERKAKRTRNNMPENQSNEQVPNKEDQQNKVNQQVE